MKHNETWDETEIWIHWDSFIVTWFRVAGRRATVDLFFSDHTPTEVTSAPTHRAIGQKGREMKTVKHETEMKYRKHWMKDMALQFGHVSSWAPTCQGSSGQTKALCIDAPPSTTYTTIASIHYEKRVCRIRIEWIEHSYHIQPRRTLDCLAASKIANLSC